MGDAHADISKHVKAYMTVFALLFLGTVLTVLVSRIEFHGHWNVVIALVIATAKASLVAAIFMHLKWETSRWIWWVLATCALFFFVLLFLPMAATQELPPQVKPGTWG